MVSFPLTALARDVARDIAASGVSQVEHEATAAIAWRVTWHTRGTQTNPYLVPPPACPECGSRLVRASACVTCPGCGWGRCG